MGVPGFFLWFLKKYKNKNFILNKNDIIKNKIDFDSLLIDTNCLLHPQCFKILAENCKTTDMDNLERKMLNSCIEYLEFIIDYVNPKKETPIQLANNCSENCSSPEYFNGFLNFVILYIIIIFYIKLVR